MAGVVRQRRDYSPHKVNTRDMQGQEVRVDEKLSQFSGITDAMPYQDKELLFTGNHKAITIKHCPTQRAPDGWESAAFSSSLRGLKLVPSKWRCLVPPTRG